MKTRQAMPWAAAAALLFLLTGVALAFGVGNVDGVWQTIDDGGGATCDDWATVGVPGSPDIPIDAIGAQLGSTNYPLQEDQTRNRLTTVCGGDEGDHTFAEWNNSTTFIWTGVGSYTGCTSATSLIFSQYGRDQRDASTDYLYIEIYNGTGAAVDLSAYSLRLYTSNYQYTTVALNSVSLGNGYVYVLVNYSARFQTNQEDQTFTDNEAYSTIVLVKEGSPQDVTAWSGTNPNIQTGSTTDENQVRYGIPASMAYGGDCPSTEAQYLLQSGFGFDGVNATADIDLGEPFYLGTFTHYNNPIWQADNRLGSVDLTLTVPIDCDDDGYSASDPDDTSFTFYPNFALDETTNSASPCAYPDGPNTQGCSDQVLVSQPAVATFTCAGTQYTVNILGFTTNEACETVYDANAAETEFLTRESFTNQACLWAEIQVPTADAGVIKTCTGFDEQDAHYVITVVNTGPGTALGAKVVDTLPDGTAYASYTSQRTVNGVTTSQGTCTVAGQVVTCVLNAALPNTTSDPTAQWVVDLKVNYASGTNWLNTVTLTTTSIDNNTANNSSTATCEPTAVELVSFTATGAAGGVVLSWETASEVDSLGFNLYRAEAADGPRMQVTGDLIPAQHAGSPLGGAYRYEDALLKPGQSYTYWLEDVDIYGRTRLYGPVEASLPGSAPKLQPANEIDSGSAKE